MKKRIITTGATGLIGKKLVKKLSEKYLITIFTRSPEKAKQTFPDCKIVKYHYTNPEEWKEHIDGTYGVIHLAGENVASGRWTKHQKQKIYNSRITSTEKIVEAINNVENRPEIFITASATGYYGYSDENVFTEDSSAGEGFLANVCHAWENAATANLPKSIRQVAIRTGIVLDKNDGALAKMLPPFKMFIGGPIGSGKQWMPWIHVDDLVNIYIEALENSSISGPVNGTAPNPVKMKEFARTLGSILHRPALFPVPGFVIKIIMGEASEIALKGAKVIPEKLEKAGFQFRYKFLQEALSEIL